MLVTYHHKGCFLHGVKQADSKIPSSVLHCNHVKCNSFWNSQDHWYDPDQDNFHSSPLWHTNSFNATPRSDCSVPEATAQIYKFKIQENSPSLTCLNSSYLHCISCVERWIWAKAGTKNKSETLTKNGSHLSILRAHKLSTVMPTDAFWMKGTSLHISTPKGQSSASSCEKKTTTIRKKKNHSQCWNMELCLDCFPFPLGPALRRQAEWGLFRLGRCCSNFSVPKEGMKEG